MTAPHGNASPDISVVVCTRNRAALLHGALASLYDLATEDEFTYEVVVVDCGSTDETAHVIGVAMQEAKHPLRGVRERAAAGANARNRGVAEARGRWIAFFDDNQLADWHWLAELYRGALEKNSRVVGGCVQLALPADCNRQLDPTVQMLLGESVGADLPQEYAGLHTPGSGNLMVERGVFDQIGPLEAAAGGGEGDDLFYRIERANLAAWFIPTAVVHQLTPAERLEQDCVLGLARRAGHQDAVRQRAARGLLRFAWLWLTRYVRLGTVQYPAWLWARMRRDPERTLGRHCELAITQGFLQGTTDKPTSKQSQRLSQPAVETGPRRPAPVFILKSGEPTVVMDVAPFALGASPAKLPSH